MSQGIQHEPNEQNRRTVEAMASHGIVELDIARVIGISAPTLRKWYSYELETAHIKANSMVAQSLYQKALGNGAGAVAACIFWLKVRAHWVEPRPEEDSKKVQAARASETAGVATGWQDDLQFEGSVQ
jgi:hypothetical protein